MAKFSSPFGVSVLIASFVFSGSAIAEPITFRGINFSMSVSKQATELERQGLTCVEGLGGTSFFPTRETHRPTICVDSSNSAETVEKLNDLYSEWLRLCDPRDENGHVSSKCRIYLSFTSLKNRVQRVWYWDDGSIVFSCNFVGTCAFDIVTVAKELQRRVIPREFAQREGTFLYCANGDDGDSLCISQITGNIWLMRDPGDMMKF